MDREAKDGAKRDLSAVRCLEEALAALLVERPAYAEILNYFGTLFRLQETTVQRPRPPLTGPALRAAAARLEPGGFLVDPGAMQVDEAAAAALLERICGLPVGPGHRQAAWARAIQEALGAGSFPLGRLARCFLFRQWGELREAALALDMDVEGVRFFVYHSIVPGLAWAARFLGAGLPDAGPWEGGLCPVCGSPPLMAALGDAGQRRMTCSLCRYAWRAPRFVCPGCGAREDRGLHYFHADQEREYRVYTCSRCHRYLKVIDTRRMARPLYAPLEDVASWHLDMVAQRAGLLPLSQRRSSVNR